MNDIYYYKYIKYKIKYLILKGGSKKRPREDNTILSSRNDNTILSSRNDNTILSSRDDNTILPSLRELFNRENSIVSNKKKKLLYNNNIYMLHFFEFLPKRQKLPRAVHYKHSYDEKLYYQYFDNILKNFDENYNNNVDEDYHYYDKDDDINDPDYKFFNVDRLLYQRLGKIIELWISINCGCPICNKMTLSPYSSSNMPIIDLVCTNKNHIGVKYFQVKSSINMNNDMNNIKYYFTNYSRDNNIQIRLSNINKNEKKKAIHSITPDSEYKDLAIGYFGIKYSWNSDTNTITIDKLKSFIVLPNTLINVNDPKYNMRDQSYYHIRDNNIIEVNTQLCFIYNLRDNEYFKDDKNNIIIGYI